MDLREGAKPEAEEGRVRREKRREGRDKLQVS